MMKILNFTSGNKYLASSKYRSYLLGKYITEFDNSIEWDFVSPSSQEISQLNYFSQIKVTLFQAYQIFFGGYDLIFIQRGIYNKFIFCFLLLNNILKLKPSIFDIDDAVFQHSPFKVKWLAKKSSMCFAGGHFTQDWLLQYNKNTIIIPTLVKFSDYEENKEFEIDTSGLPVIGWLGNAEGHINNLKLTAEILKKVYEEKIPFKFLLVGARGMKIVYEMFNFLPTEQLEIINYVQADTDQKLIPYIRKFDIGIMPLENDEWSKGKSSLKALQYMAANIAVIISGVGENNYVVNSGVDGIIANTKVEWLEAFKKLLGDKKYRKEMAKKGMQTVKKKYSYEGQLQEIISAFSSLMERK